jgi:hypothetical protein
MRPLTSTLVALALFSCGQATTLLPDGGRTRQVCTEEAVPVVVRVLQRNGEPAEGATVTATNLGSGKQLTATTRSDGVTTAITLSPPDDDGHSHEDIGPGSVLIRATQGTRVSGGQQVNGVCGECHCSLEPNVITLTLSD